MILLIDREALFAPLLSACLGNSPSILRTIAETDSDDCEACQVPAVLVVGRIEQGWRKALDAAATTGSRVVRIARDAADLSADDGRAFPVIGPAIDLALLRSNLPPELASHLRADDGGAIDRLGVLLGKEVAADMVVRFHMGLAEGVAAIEGGADMAPIGHRLGGMAGMLGLPLLSAAWLGLQRDARLWPAARAITAEALREAGITLGRA